MKIEPFKLERYFAEHEFTAPYLLSCSDCESMPVDDLLSMEPGSEDEFKKLWLGYTESQGHPMLRDQIANLYTGVDSSQILVHSGAEEAIFNFMNVLLVPGDHIIVHYPCYQSLLQIAVSIGCKVTLWKAESDSNWRLDLDFLRRHLRNNTKLVIINCPHNPTGYLMPLDEFRELADLSQKHGFTIFSDEVYRLLEYDENDRLPALCDIDQNGVSLGVMSKAFGLAGLRIGWIATKNKPLYRRLAEFKDYTTICNSAPSEFLAAIGLKHKDALVSKNLAIIRQNLVILDRFFGKHPDTFNWKAPKAGPIAFPSYRKGDVEIFCRDLIAQAGVLLVPGTIFESPSVNFRIGFGRKNMEAGIEKFETYLRR